MTSKFASLYAGLLARKGQATPVFSNPAVSYVDAPRPVQERGAGVARRDVASADGLPLIAEKMMASRYSRSYGAEPAPLDEAAIGRLTKTTNGSRPPLRAVGAPAPRQPMREDADREHQPYRFTFRMPPEQRRRLRVAAAQKDCSLQQSLGAALDAYLDGRDDEAAIGRLTPKMNRTGTRVSAETRGRPPLRAVGAPAPREPMRKGADDERHGPHRFAFRMSPEQRRRLRLAATRKDCSLQHQLCEALDEYLDDLCACSLKDCACLARRDGGHRN